MFDSKKIFSRETQTLNNGKIYEVLNIFGIKIKSRNIRKQLSAMEKELRLLRTLLEKSIDITKIPKATGNLRKVQLIKTKILEIADVVLKKYNIEYWLDFGTLIGAIRHKGFIPWDDDIDLCMMKENYLKLPKIFDKELKKYGLNYIYCDIYGSQLIKLCYKDFLIDFFPMEYLNKHCYDDMEKKSFVTKRLKCRDLLLQKYPVKDFISGKYNQLKVIPYVDKLKREVIDKNYQENPETNQIIRSIESMTVTNKCAVFDNQYIFPLENIQFEDLSLPAPVDPLYHLWQTNEYGDYGDVMNFPKINDSGFGHTQEKYSSGTDYDKILAELDLICTELKK